MEFLDDGKAPDELISSSECHWGDGHVEIFKNPRGDYRVIHSLFGENPWSGDWERLNHERVCHNGLQVRLFLLETMDTVFGEPSWYITEALEGARKEDANFRF